MRAVKRSRLAAISSSQYDAARPGDTQRSNFWLAMPLTGEKEFTVYNRKNILRKKRALEANLSVIGALLEKVSRYSIGSGVVPKPSTSDRAWNTETARRFREWGSNPQVCDSMGLMDFWEMQQWAAKTYRGEGEVFAAMVRSPGSNTCQLQILDNGEVEYLPSINSFPVMGTENSFIDGCKLDKSGRIVAYTVRTVDGGGYTEISARNTIHLADRKRPSQYRGLCPFHAGANSAMDALDIKGLEIASAKIHSFLAMYISKQSGPGAGASGLTGSLQSLLQTATANPTQDNVTVSNALGENIYSGGAIAHLGPGEEIKLLTSSRPSMPTLDFLAWLFRDISVGFGLPIEFIWDMSDLGGVNSRIKLEDAQHFFDLTQKTINLKFSQRVYTWWLANEIQNGYALPADPVWWACHWQGPAKITGDSGRQAQADVLFLENGMRTLSDHWAGMGADWRDKLTQRVDEVQFAKNLCQEKGIDYATVFPPKAGAAPNQNPSMSGGGSSGGNDGAGT